MTAATAVQLLVANLRQQGTPEDVLQRALALTDAGLAITPGRIDDDTFESIMADIAAGEFAYKAAQDHGYTIKAFWHALNVSEARGKSYAGVKHMGMERMAEEIVQLADWCREGVRTKTFPDGTVETITADMIERAKLQIDTRKWLLARLMPRKYGDKLELSGNSDSPLAITIAPQDDKL